MRKQFNNIVVSINRVLTLWAMVLAVIVLSSCGGDSDNGNGATADSSPQKIVLSLDWTPNTNHIGAYVADSLGYFADEGLDVDIIQPAEATAESLVAIGKADFAYSYQESVTFARTSEDKLPIVALAAVIQHNTSGFASLTDKNIQSVDDFVGKTYGGWGSPVEAATLKTLLEADGHSLDDITILNTGSADFFAASDRDIDFSWVFEGWTVVEARLRGVELNYLNLADLNPVFDYYTPVIITSESLLQKDPAMVRRFMKALSRGYDYAVANPEAAADILVKEVPEIKPDLAKQSMLFLQDKFVADASRWGEMKAEVWQRYAGWLLDNQLIPQPLDVQDSFTNAYLPK